MATLAVLFFAATALALTAYSIGPFGLAEEDRPPIQAALFWIILFFAAATGLPRAFVREEETGTALALRKTLPGSLVLAGKALFNFGLFLAIAAVVVPGFLLLLDWRVSAPAALAAVVVFGGYGSLRRLDVPLGADGARRTAERALRARRVPAGPAAAADGHLRNARRDPGRRRVDSAARPHRIRWGRVMRGVSAGGGGVGGLREKLG